MKTACNLLLAVVLLGAPAAAQGPASAWLEAAKLTASDFSPGYFGRSTDVDHDTIAVGANRGGQFPGAAYVYHHGLRSKLTGPDGFGFALSLDGSTLAVGAYGADDNGDDSGSAYVFRRLGSVWTREAVLLPADGATADWFGVSIAVSAETIVVGAVGDDLGAGSVYVFRRGLSGWSEQAKLVAPDRAPHDKFGRSVSVSGDRIVVGAYADDDRGPNSGSAYVFRRDGTTWTVEAKLTASDGTWCDCFGTAVAIDGDTIVVGSPYSDVGEADSGAVYLFRRQPAGWVEQAKLIASEGAAADQLGFSVALDEQTVLAGAWCDDDEGEDAGAVLVFREDSAGWIEDARLTAGDGAARDQFGVSLAIDGPRLVVGAWCDDDLGHDSGSAYVFAHGKRNNGP